MKYIKTYETLRLLKLSNKSIWIIYGNKEEQYAVLDMLKNKILNTELELDLELLISELKDDYNEINAIGLILTYTDKSNFFYYTFDTNEEKKEVIERDYDKFTLKGELRIVNNTIALDTIELYRDKYNL